jgi:tRNA(fMet)-specific endonuclease VapC
MVIMLDAGVIIQGEKGDFDLKGWLATRSQDEFEIAAITLAELWHGVERASAERRTRRVRYLQSVLAPLPIISYTEQTAYIHARIWAQLEAEGKRTGYYDLILAATALMRGNSVATFNRRHFDVVPGLIVMEPALD